MAIVLTVIVSILSINSINFIAVTDDFTGNENSSCNRSHEITRANTYVDIVVRVYIPYVVMVTINTKVIIRLRKSKRQSNARTDRSTRFATSTILIDLIFLIFNLPETLLYAYQNITQINHSRALFFVFLHLSGLFSSSYSAVLIFIFLFFNRIFRKETVALFRLHIIFHRFIRTDSDSR